MIQNQKEDLRNNYYKMKERCIKMKEPFVRMRGLSLKMKEPIVKKRELTVKINLKRERRKN